MIKAFRKKTDNETEIRSDINRAEADAIARAEDIMRDSKGPIADGQRAMIRFALEQFYNRGAIDALNRMRKTL